MASVNQATIIGNLGRDPEMRYMPSGDAIATISVATTESWKDKNTGEKKEETEWHRITFFGRLAEIVGQYLVKGSSVYVQGRLKTNKYTDKDGIERYATGIIGETMRMLGGASKGDGANDNGTPIREQARGQGHAPPASRPQPRPAPNFSDMDDDIPF
jgi:single-strand DNA-binding protein